MSRKRNKKSLFCNEEGFKRIYSVLFIFVFISGSIILISYMTNLYLDNSVAKKIVNPDREKAELLKDIKTPEGEPPLDNGAPVDVLYAAGNIEDKLTCLTYQDYVWCSNFCVELESLVNNKCSDGTDPEVLEQSNNYLSDPAPLAPAEIDESMIDDPAPVIE